MKRLLAGGLALGFVGIGTALIAAPGGAQEESGAIDFIENLDSNLTPITVQGGGTVTVTSVDPCPSADEVVTPFTTIAWGVGSPDWLDTTSEESIANSEVFDAGTAPLNADGSWTVTFQAPSAPGEYDFLALCSPDVAAGDGAEDAVAEAAETLGGHPEEPECPDPDGAEAQGGDEGDEPECPEPCPPGDIEAQGGDHTSSSDTTPTTVCPPTTDTTAPPTVPPPDDEFGIWLYGPESFTVTPGAAPVPDQPDNFG